MALLRSTAEYTMVPLNVDANADFACLCYFLLPVPFFTANQFGFV